jgi:hypothetical protein
MPFKHSATSEEACLLEKGEYDATVKTATPKTSKRTGNAMMEMIIRVFGPDGRREEVFDYLVDSDKAAWKTRNFCVSAGVDYDTGEIDERAIEGASVRILLGVEPAQGGYPAKNKILDYLPREGDSAPPLVAKPEGEFVATDDDVPF